MSSSSMIGGMLSPVRLSGYIVADLPRACPEPLLLIHAKNFCPKLLPALEHSCVCVFPVIAETWLVLKFRSESSNFEDCYQNLIII